MSNLRRIFIAAAFSFVPLSSGLGAEPVVGEPECADYFRLAVSGDFFLRHEPFPSRQATARSGTVPSKSFIPSAPKITAAAADKNWGAYADRLTAAKLPAKVVKKEFAEGESAVVLLDLEAPSEDFLYRSVRRLAAKWAAAEPGGKFPKIYVVGDEWMGAASASYHSRRNEIYLRASELAEYLDDGDFPISLSHELRHAGFERFSGIRHAGGRNFTSALELRSERGLLETAAEGYATYASAEETYTHLRDLRKTLARMRVKVARILGDASGPVPGRIAAAIQFALPKARAKTKQTVNIIEGMRRDIEKVFGAAADGTAVVRVSGRSSTVFIRFDESAERTLKASVYCPNCTTWWWSSRREHRARTLLETVRENASVRLGETGSAATETLADLVELEAKLRLASRGEAVPPLTAEAVRAEFDALLAKIVKVIESEPRFGD